MSNLFIAKLLNDIETLEIILFQSTLEIISHGLCHNITVQEQQKTQSSRNLLIDLKIKGIHSFIVHVTTRLIKKKGDNKLITF